MYDHHYKEKKESFKKLKDSKNICHRKILNRGLTVLKGEITLVLFKKNNNVKSVSKLVSTKCFKLTFYYLLILENISNLRIIMSKKSFPMFPLTISINKIHKDLY
jgi:hypothetical protein